MTKPASSRLKFAFTGTNCAGKTTMALGTTYRLKAEKHVLAEVVASQDRKVNWKPDHFAVDIRAHYGMISNLIRAEVEAELRGDATVVLVDRSVLDLYANAAFDHPGSVLLPGLEHMVRAWIGTYRRIYYLEPLPFQHDGKRPGEDFRDGAQAKLLDLIRQWKLPNVTFLMRDEVYDNICDLMRLANVIA